MSLVIFAFGVLVFLITVYGTVVAGGLLLTRRQLDDQPELLPDGAVAPADPDIPFSRARTFVSPDY